MRLKSQLLSAQGAGSLFPTLSNSVRSIFMGAAEPHLKADLAATTPTPLGQPRCRLWYKPVPGDLREMSMDVVWILTKVPGWNTHLNRLFHLNYLFLVWCFRNQQMRHGYQSSESSAVSFWGFGHHPWTIPLSLGGYLRSQTGSDFLGLNLQTSKLRF